MGQVLRCNHNPMSQKGCWIAKKNSQKMINIYVFPFKAVAIMASCCFDIHMNVRGSKPKIHLMKFEVLIFDLTFKNEQEHIGQK
jgi:hypothetical protein